MDPNTTADNVYTVPLQQRTILAGVFGFLQVLTLVGVFLMCARRKYQPIRSRLPTRVVIATLFMQVDMILCFIAFYLDQMVTGNLTITFIIMFFFTLSPLITRTLTIFSSYEISLLLSEKGTENIKEVMESGNFYVRNAKFLCSAKLHYGFMLLSFGVHFLITRLRQNSPIQDFSLFVQTLGGSAIIFAFGFVYFSQIVYFSCRMSSFHDGLHLKHELQLTAAGVAFTVVVCVLIRMLSSSDQTGAVGFAFGPFSIILAQIAMPLYYSYRWDSGKKAKLRLDVSSYNNDYEQSTSDLGSSVYKDVDQLAMALDGEKGLAIIVRNKDARDIFFEFCRQELNHENLMFYEEAKAFLKKYSVEKEGHADAAKFNFDAKKLYTNYLRHGAILEVNVSSKVREFCKSAGLDSDSIITDKALTAIGTALREVVNLIVNDPLYRFRTSNKFGELFDKFSQGLVEA